MYARFRGGLRLSAITGIRFSRRISQESVVFLIALAAFVLFSLTLDSFLQAENMLVLLRSVSILGILSVGMAVVVIGRGIDLSIVAAYAMPAAWTLQLVTNGVPL